MVATGSILECPPSQRRIFSRLPEGMRVEETLTVEVIQERRRLRGQFRWFSWWRDETCTIVGV